MDNDSISTKLQELFDLYKSGALNKEEYDLLKSGIIGKKQEVEDSSKTQETIEKKKPDHQIIKEEEPSGKKELEPVKEESTDFKETVLENQEQQNLDIPAEPKKEREKNKVWITVVAVTAGILAIVLIYKFSQTKSDITDVQEQTVTDIDGNIYNTVKIGKQVWMVQNLNVEIFRNGDPIMEAKTPEEWQKAAHKKISAWCYDQYNPANSSKYGKLYNWYAVSDERGLAPEGWHIPSDEEWKILSEYLGGYENDGIKMKNISGWNEGGNGNNESGFFALPSFGGNNAVWWTTTASPYVSTQIIYRILSYNYNFLGWSDNDKGTGYSVRCVKN